nr:SWI/SNF-related matrix-associated actin-dependent regulator of chromatin subfamily A-like protein 1 isoform X1 [Onthophagus taurus]
MQCTPAEIEEKRRQAQLKLLAKSQHNPINNHNSPSTSLNHQNKFNFKLYNKSKSEVFYGSNKVVTISFSLISESRFVANSSDFHEASVHVFKSISSKNYNAKSKNWDFDLKDYELLEQKLLLLHPQVVLVKLPQFVIKTVKIQKGDDKIDLSRIDNELLSALMPFQEEGVCFGIDKGGRCLIADEMGLGKTFQALGIASYYRDDWPLLIVTTASMKNVWEETIHKYLPSVSIMETQYMITRKDYIGDAKVLIVSHDMMSRCGEKLLERNFGVIIIDESHTIKNFKAKCTQVATLLAKKSKRIVLLSGTPALSRPNELYSQLSLIDSKFFGGFIGYSTRYCDGKTTSFGWDATGQSNLQELEIVLRKKFMIRRTKADVLQSLSKKVQEVVVLDVKLNQLSENDRNNLTILSDKFNRGKALEKHSALLTFFSETSRIKIPSVCSFSSYVLEILNTTSKFLIFAHHQQMLDAVQKILNNRKIKFIRIDGYCNSEQRKINVDKFQFDDSYTCALLSITAANAGITLTKAQLIIFAELHWNPSILSQAESRAHRIGQQEQVTVRYLLAPGTADDYMWPLLQEKQKILSEIGLTKESYQNVEVKKQHLVKSDEIRNCLENCLGSSHTECGTLDISSYFESPKKKLKMENKNDEGDLGYDLFNDGFNDLLSSIDI